MDVDRYALECLRLFLFLPLTSYSSWNPPKHGPCMRPLEAISVRYRRWVRSFGRTLTASGTRLRPCSGGAGWPALRDSLVAGIHTAATRDRTNRLFPGDPAQFATWGIALGSGAAGVLLASVSWGRRSRTNTSIGWSARLAGLISRQP